MIETRLTSTVHKLLTDKENSQKVQRSCASVRFLQNRIFHNTRS